MRHAVVSEDLAEIASASLPFERMRGKTVLVSGAGGFLPSYMVETLLYLNETRGLGATVLALERDAARAQARFSHYEGRGDLRVVRQDVAEPLEYGGPVDFIVHAASPASPKRYLVDPVGTILPNVIGTRNLLDLAQTKKSEAFLFFSSAEVYGEPDDCRSTVSEAVPGRLDPMHPRACYAESKRMGETMCAAWHRQFGVPAKIVRVFHTYGPGMDLQDGRVFCDFVRDIVAGKDILVESDGRAVRPFCYLSDAVRAFFTVLLLGVPGEAYNVANDEARLSVMELAERLAGLFQSRGVGVQLRGTPQPSTGAVSRCSPDISKLRGLGWQPRHAIEVGFRRTVETYL
ncbi:MAG: NAD-dependent epimerase/dehydratase family protein [Elusimicrobiota bacterium]